MCGSTDTLHVQSVHLVEHMCIHITVHVMCWLCNHVMCYIIGHVTVQGLRGHVIGHMPDHMRGHMILSQSHVPKSETWEVTLLLCYSWALGQVWWDLVGFLAIPS